MIAKISHGNGFRGVCAYLLREGKEDDLGWEAYVIDTNMSGRTARQLAHEFGVLRQGNHRVKQPVFHASLRLPTGEALSPEQWGALARQYLARMGYVNTPFLVVKHPENHIHVVASRVRFDGAGVPTWQERWRSGAVTHEIEQAYDLSHTRRPKREQERDRSKVRERSSERHRAARRGEAPGRLALARRIDQALSGCDGSREDLTRELAASGVETRWYTGRDGRTRGVSFALRDEQGVVRTTCKGSAIGPLYGWTQLEARLQAPAEAQPAKDEGPRVADGGEEREQTDRHAVSPAAREQREVALEQPLWDGTAALAAEYQALVAQEWREVGFLGAGAVLHAAATALAERHPELGLAALYRGIEAARPDSIARLPGGWEALWAQMEQAQREGRGHLPAAPAEQGLGGRGEPAYDR